MKRCFLSRKQTLPEEGRSVGGFLTPKFLGTFAAAVHVDLLHSLSLVKYEALPDKATRDKFKVVKPRTQVARFINLRATMQNLLVSTEDWNSQCNKLSEIVKPTFLYKIGKVEPAIFEDSAELLKHAVDCYGYSSGRGRSRGR